MSVKITTFKYEPKIFTIAALEAIDSARQRELRELEARAGKAAAALYEATVERVSQEMWNAFFFGSPKE